MSRQEWKTSYSEHMHAHTRMCARVHIRRRTMLVVELKTNIIPKNWITVIVHRRTPVVRQRIVPAYQYTRNMRACVRAWESASEKLSELSPQSSSLPRFNFPLFSSARLRYLTNSRYISTTRDDVARYMMDTGKPLASEIHVFL